MDPSLSKLILPLLLLSGTRTQIPMATSSRTVSSNQVSTGTLLTDSQTSSRSAVDHLLTIGKQNNFPIGLVITDDALCARDFLLTHKEYSESELMAEINRVFPTYRASASGGVLFIRPRKMPSENQKLLELAIPHFSARPNTHQAIGVALSMSISSVLEPGQAQGFAGGSSTAAETVAGIDVDGKSVEQILNLIVQKGHGGVWFMKKLDKGWITSSGNLPYIIVGYSDAYGGLNRLGCAANAER